MTSISRLAALALLALITFATLSPIELRPRLSDPNIERALAYVLLGLALALGFPSRVTQTVLFVCAVAGVLEVLQLFDPGRHARFVDGLLKAAAGVVGIVLGRFVITWVSRAAERR
ncbi:hypothetical protein EOA27_02925 [Mesorhizobium sp. M2A.F.Ca.ET.037.01.1.1]|uniref:VanZ family protein n=1 Tax=unclassified Mesorhizobium TaxID=325217 RepID=UPI000FCA8A38|nr:MULTISPECIES: VanZ family protein [unclassified Mesorhizobium]RUX98993.1 hypothetical protein EOA25_26785 [Mesorhizobium sp. M2A.F.Ca.ET.040.01.1.1]RVC60515.1 hypothetical protein EN759_30790 [Mesorhizobium sp. M00.F.Ca.ET.038.03.1.1]RVC74135.1 hypothetical protein EN766_19110 [Mesorhizobium sp. M2A.F.Ca.ET.046.02.1.1]RUX22659.1 hypothetical protein EOA27_02925 [Mesorhizobium sp. M2A.F.Ca.ET.037.01.1.1]RWA85430.1 MAG: hypothetical protein EOQ31_26640 [Mesorhizobium sp.]